MIVITENQMEVFQASGLTPLISKCFLDASIPISKEDEKKYSYSSVNGVPFFKGSTDSNEVDINDVKQGALGDCYLMAAISAVAKNNPDLIKNLIKDNEDGTFDVTIYDYEHWWSLSRIPHTITVDSSFPLRKNGNPAYAKFGDTDSSGKQELWPMLLEKAYAKHKGGYDQIEGGNPGVAMEIFTQKNSETHTTKNMDSDEILTLLKENLDKGNPITASTKDLGNDKKAIKEADDNGVYEKHAYVITGVDTKNKTISLHNPWGSDHVKNIPVDDFKKFYYRIQTVD